MTAKININDFMTQFHMLERDLALFDQTVDRDLWWDSIRFEVCYFLYDCLTGLTYSSAHRPVGRPHPLGHMRRTLRRQALFAAEALRHRDLLVLRAPRSLVEGMQQDVVLDPMIALLGEKPRIINTVPRRYHLPDCDLVQWAAAEPAVLPDIIGIFLETFGIDVECARPLSTLIRNIRAEHRCHIHAYHRLFDRLRPAAVLLVQNGIEKALFHVANTRGVPTIEAQHGLIGFGHPAYSYPRGIDYDRQTGMPGLFLTFSDFWSIGGHYPAKRHAVVGTDHFATGIAPIATALGTIMIISADIYHHDLVEVARAIAQAMPERKVIYKLHPNQRNNETDIIVSLADLPNIVIGSASTPAINMMNDVSHLVTIQSTVVYEAVQHGRRVCILPRHDYHIHSDIFDNSLVCVPKSTLQLIEALKRPAKSGCGPTFFTPFDPGKARRLVEAVIMEGRCGRVPAS